MTMYILLLISVFAFANGLPPPAEIEKSNDKNDYVFMLKANNPNQRLAGWTVLQKNKTNHCNMVRKEISTFGYCWQDENVALNIDTTKERGWVREVIQQWEKCGGIKFVEEPKCRIGKDFVKVVVGNYHPMVMPQISDIPTCKVDGFTMYLSFYTTGEGMESYRRHEKVTKAIIQMYALHEFGHFLGFDHEHNRNDRQDKIECATTVDEALTGENAMYGNAPITQSYDIDSIMNYCRPNSHYKPWLSEEDKKGVRVAYGAGKKINQAECDAVTKPWKWGSNEGLDEFTLGDLAAPIGACRDRAGKEQCDNLIGSCKDDAMKHWCAKTCKFCQ